MGITGMKWIRRTSHKKEEAIVGLDKSGIADLRREVESYLEKERNLYKTNKVNEPRTKEEDEFSPVRLLDTLWRLAEIEKERELTRNELLMANLCANLYKASVM